MADGVSELTARLGPSESVRVLAPAAKSTSRTSLRSRILLSHVIVIAVAVALTFVVALVPVRRSITRFEVRQLQDRAAPVAAETAFVMQRSNLGANAVNELLDLQSRQQGTRILLFGPDGSLLHDTAPNQSLPADTLARIHATANRLPAQARQTGPLSRIPLATNGSYGGVTHQQQLVMDAVPQSGGAYLALMAPVQHLPVARELFVPVLLAGAIGVIGAIIATFFLSRSIARPVSRLTAAADAVASGDLDHQIPGEGPGEVGRLIHSFNVMVRQLRSAADSQRRLLSNVAHELRTPLTSIQGYAEGLAEGVFNTPAERREALETISEESERVNELVIQILQLARLESRQAEPQLRPVNVAELVARVIRRHRVTAEQAGVQLSGDEVGSQTVMADEGLLDQAIDNLVRNAIRHTPSGGSVTVSSALAPRPTGQQTSLVIRVSDTGSGIPPEALAHVFDRFYRASDAGSSPTAGFGLGLAIVREIAISHGGDVSVESEVGRGTRFAIELPLRRAAADSETVSGILGEAIPPR